jgi:hypothetical protein
VLIYECRHCGRIQRSSDGRARGACLARQQWIGWVINPRVMIAAQTAARLKEWAEADRDNVRASGKAQPPDPVDPTAQYERPWWCVRRWNGGRD